MLFLLHSLQDARWKSIMWQVIWQCLIPIWLLSYFLLPNTLWEKISPGAFLAYWGVNYASVSNFLGLLALCAIAITLLFHHTSLGKKASSPILVPLTTYLAILLISLFFYMVDGNNVIFKNVSSVLVAITTGLISCHLCGRADRAVIVICLFGLIQGLYTIAYQKIGINGLVSGNIVRAGGTFNRPDGVYTLMIVCLPLAISQALSATKIQYKAFFMLCATIAFAALIVTWYRGGILGVIVSFIWLAYRFVPNKLNVLTISICLVGLYVLVAYHRIEGPVNQLSSNRSISGRYLLWKNGFSIFQENWITGVGVGALIIPLKKSDNVPGKDIYSIEAEPKNNLLFWLDELGIAGGILGGFFIVAIYKVIRLNSSNATAVGIGAAWLALLVSGLFDTPIGVAQRYYGNAIFGCLLSATLLLSTYVEG